MSNTINAELNNILNTESTIVYPIRIDSKELFIELTNKLGVRPDWKDVEEQNVRIEQFGHEFNRGGVWGHSSVASPDVVQKYVVVYHNERMVAEINLADLFYWSGLSIMHVEATVATPKKKLLEYTVFDRQGVLSEMVNILKIEDLSDLEITPISETCAHVFKHGASEDERNGLLTCYDEQNMVYINNGGKHEFSFLDPEEAYNQIIEKFREEAHKNMSVSELYNLLDDFARNGDIPRSAIDADDIFEEAMEGAGSRVNWKNVSEDLGFDADDVLYEKVKDDHGDVDDERQLEVAENHFGLSTETFLDALSNAEIGPQEWLKIAEKVLRESDNLDEEVLKAAYKH